MSTFQSPLRTHTGSLNHFDDPYPHAHLPKEPSNLDLYLQIQHLQVKFTHWLSQPAHDPLTRSPDRYLPLSEQRAEPARVAVWRGPERCAAETQLGCLR